MLIMCQMELHVLLATLFCFLSICPFCSQTHVAPETTLRPPVNHTISLSTTDYDSENRKSIPIYIGGYFSHGGAWDCSGVLPAVEMALDHVNARVDILPDYDLRMVWNDTQCDAGLGTRGLFDQLFHPPQKLLLIGDGCSTSSQAIAGTAYHWNLNMMSYAASAPTLSNRFVYPYFYRTIMPDTMFNAARIRVMREFNWTRVGTIHGKHEIFSLTADNLLDKLHKANITVVTSETFASEDPTNQIQKLKSLDVKIVTMNMYATKARRVMCEAYRNNMVGAGYVWMLVGWYAQEWWTIPDEPYDKVQCSAKEMKKAVESSLYISTESLQLSPSSELTVANITAAQYVNMLKQYMKDPKWANYVWHNDHPFGYDATWAIALMLDKAVTVLKTKDRRLEDFTYDYTEMGKIFFDLLNETRFTGVSGPVSFRDGDRVGIIQIRQLQAGCPNSSWVLHDQECFLLVYQPRTYSDAAHYCRTVESEVAAIVSKTEHQFIQQEIRNREYLPELNWWYIGLNLSSTGSGSEWIDSRYQKIDWSPPGSDLSRDGGQCVYMTSNAHDGWKTVNCDIQLPFVCKAHAEFLERPVALFSDNGKEGGHIEWTGTFIWPGGDVPMDHTPEIVVSVKHVHQGIDLPLYIAMCTLAGLGIILALFFLVFNLKFRNKRFVKMSSPNLNNVIILGSIFVYIGIFVGGFDSNLVSVKSVALSCQLRVWMLSVGFVLAFGSMFSKTWRVHKVAAFKTPKRKIISDQQLFLMVLVLLLVDIAVLTTWHIMDPLVVLQKTLHETDDPNVLNQRLIPYFEYCWCKYSVYWMVSLYIYKGLLLIFGAFLAWETRQVTLPALNDSKLIGICVYNVIVLCTIGVAVSYIINNDPAILYMFTSCVVFFCTTITLLIVFVPKIISVYKYPNGPPDMTGPLTSNGGRTSQSTLNRQETDSKIEVLAKENQIIKQQLAMMAAENKRLKGFNSDVENKFQNSCGMWCVGVVCGCCVNAPEEIPTFIGKDNKAFDINVI